MAWSEPWSRKLKGSDSSKTLSLRVVGLSSERLPGFFRCTWSVGRWYWVLTGVSVEVSSPVPSFKLAHNKPASLPAAAGGQTAWQNYYFMLLTFVDENSLNTFQMLSEGPLASCPVMKEHIHMSACVVCSHRHSACWILDIKKREKKHMGDHVSSPDGVVDEQEGLLL